MNIANEWLRIEAKMFYNCSFYQSLLAKTMWHEVISKKRLLFMFTQVLSSKFMIFTDWEKHLHYTECRDHKATSEKLQMNWFILPLFFVFHMTHFFVLCNLRDWVYLLIELIYISLQENSWDNVIKLGGIVTSCHTVFARTGWQKLQL